MIERRAITACRGSRSWGVNHAGWVVTLHSSEEQDCSGKTLEEALAWSQVWLMASELGGGDVLGLGFPAGALACGDKIP